MMPQKFFKVNSVILFLLFISFTHGQENSELVLSSAKIIGSAGLNSTIDKIDMTGEILENTSEIIEKGFVYSTSEKLPTINDTKIAVESSESLFKTELGDLLSDTVYYLRPFATIDNITIYGGLTIIDTSKQSNIDIDTKSRIKTYPNPSTNFISLAGLMETKSYIIYSTAGKELARGSVYYNNKIDVRFLEKGLYLLKLANIEIIKFIKA
ncbi:MAG: T9SS type A sorting domain-containing protein [Flavobacteriaceae bacterium]|tara:strand:+ start:187 stop:819 length:633 start_codon:yes stop_codon:yes gene_type:complete